MGQMMLVTLREGIEMFLIVAIAATYLRKTDRAGLLSAVRWGVAGNIVIAWVLTIPMAALAAALAFWLIHLLVA